MYLRRDYFKRIARAPAKLNLYLEVMDRRDDGFHDVETLIVPIRLSDSLRLEATPRASDGGPGQIQLEIRACWPVRELPPQRIPVGAENLVVRALELLRERSGCRLGAVVELAKRIPAAAGLGGGSSDAAAALRLANSAWQINWPPDRLAEVAAELGSDVPFFLSPGPAICRGRGDRVERLCSLPRLHFVIVKPPADFGAAEVYRAHDEFHGRAKSCNTRRLNELAPTLASGKGGNPGGWMQNRLQAAAASLSPWVERLQMVFNQLDCLAHQLTGSGSAYFGVCRHAQHARRLATLLRTRQLGLVYATCSYP